MTELELYQFVYGKENIKRDADIRWNGDQLNCWFSFWELDYFTSMVGDDYFTDGALEVHLTAGSVVVDLAGICSDFGIDPTKILAKP